MADGEWIHQPSSIIHLREAPPGALRSPAMDKHAAAHVLDQIASFLELKGDNPFRVRAFRNAAQAVQNYGGDVAAALGDGTLGDVTSIGPATLEVVREVMASGRSTVLENLKREVPEGLV